MLPRNIDLTDQRLFQKEFKFKRLPISHVPVSVKMPWHGFKIVFHNHCERCGRLFDEFPWNNRYRELCDYCENELRKAPWFFSPQMKDNRDRIF